MKIYIIALCLLVTTAFAECTNLFDNGKLVQSTCYPTERTAKNVKKTYIYYNYGYNSKTPLEVNIVMSFKDGAHTTLTWFSTVYGTRGVRKDYNDMGVLIESIDYEFFVPILNMVNETRTIYE